MRYSLKTGKYGIYFRDNEQNIDLSLQEVLFRLNNREFILDNFNKTKNMLKEIKKIILNSEFNL